MSLIHHNRVTGLLLTALISSMALSPSARSADAQPPGSVKQLVAEVESPDRLPCIYAAVGLVRMGPKGSHALINALKRLKGRLSCEFDLLRVIATIGTPDSVAVLASQLGHPLRGSTAANHLRDMGQAALAPVIAVLEGGDEPARDDATAALRQDDPRAVSALIGALGDPSERVRKSAQRSLAEIGEPALNAVREAYLSAQDPVLSAGTMEILVRMGEPATRQALTSLDSAPAAEHAKLTQLLRHMGYAAVPSLIAAVGSTGEAGTVSHSLLVELAGTDYGEDQTAWREWYARHTIPCPGKTLSLPGRGLRLQLEQRVARPSRYDTVCDVLAVYPNDSPETTQLAEFRLNPDDAANPDFRMDFRFGDYTPHGPGVVVLRKAKALRLYFVDENRLSETVWPFDCIGEDGRTANLEDIMLLEEGAWIYARATSCKPLLVDTSATRARFPFREEIASFVIFASRDATEDELLAVDTASRSLHAVIEHDRKGARFSLAYFLNTRGMDFYRTGNFRQAEEWFSHAADVAPPEFVVPHTNLASTLALQGQREKSLDKLREACELDPTFTRPRMLNDEDYAGLRDDPTFNEILDGPCRAQKTLPPVTGAIR